MNIWDVNGILMSRDKPLAEIQSGDLVAIFSEDLLPLHLQRVRDVEDWLKQRSVDAHRAHSRLLKKVLRLSEKDDLATVMHSYAATITDNYWIKPIGSTLQWDDVKFSENYFADLALRGDLDAFTLDPSHTPELTNVGSFEKCWKLEDGTWWMYKRGNKLELFSELFVYNLGVALGFPMAHYELVPGNAVRSRDYTGGAAVNFESMYGLVGDDEDYQLSYDKLIPYGTHIVDRYVEILIMDTICLNADRHTGNYGVFRDVSSGEVIGMAPNYDNNICLISDGYKDHPRKPDLMGRLLRDFERDTGAVSDYLTRHKIPQITEDMIRACAMCTGIEVDMDYLVQFVLCGYNQTPLPDLVGSCVHQSTVTKMDLEFSSKTDADKKV